MKKTWIISVHRGWLNRAYTIRATVEEAKLYLVCLALNDRNCHPADDFYDGTETSLDVEAISEGLMKAYNIYKNNSSSEFIATELMEPEEIDKDYILELITYERDILRSSHDLFRKSSNL